MKKSTKGAVAAGAAAVLMLGGAGSLAYWTAEANVAGSTISSGQMNLSGESCTGWKLDGGAGVTSTTKLVPGDTVSNICTYTINAEGDHLSATVAAVAPTQTATAPKSTFGDLTSTYQVGTGAATATNSTITEANNGDRLTVKMVLDFKYGTADSAETVVNGNGTQNQVQELGGYKVTLTQNHDAS